MATLLSSLITAVRFKLQEPTARHWSDAELLDDLNRGIADLWRGINELRQKHFCTLATGITQAANATTLTGMPADVVRIHSLEPADVSSTGTGRLLRYEYKPYQHPVFQSARSSDSVDPATGGVVYFDLTEAGGPVEAPIVYVAPKLSSAVSLAAMYVPSLAALTASDANPIPCGSDNALIAWTVAFARAKERPDRAPDPVWLQVYATEKKAIIIACDERQDQDQETADALFEPYWT